MKSPRPTLLGDGRWELVGGEILVNVHSSDKCRHERCCIHNPSDHHMRDWPQHFRQDRGMMERICEHGVGHPDPDDYIKNRDHGCDGCCIPPPPFDPEILKETLLSIVKMPDKPKEQT